MRGHRNRGITYCKRGHEFTAENTRVKPRDGARSCRTCEKLAGAEYRAKHSRKRAKQALSWRQNNREHVLAYGKDYWLKHRERYLVQQQEWRAAHPEKSRQYSRKRRAVKTDQLGLWWHVQEQCVLLLRRYQKGFCHYCEEEMLPNAERTHPQKENLEHVIPLSRNGAHGFDNWVLSCRLCNATKNKRTPQEFSQYMNRPKAGNA